MRGHKALGPESGGDRIEALEDRSLGRTCNLAKPKAETQAAVRAELIGDDICTTAGITARSDTPILTLCRRLIEAGHDPRTPLEAWRGTTLCLRISSISAGSRLMVKERPFGPVFEPWVPFSTPPVSPPIAPSEGARYPRMGAAL